MASCTPHGDWQLSHGNTAFVRVSRRDMMVSEVQSMHGGRGRRSRPHGMDRRILVVRTSATRCVESATRLGLE